MPSITSLRNIATAERRHHPRPLHCTGILNAHQLWRCMLCMQVPEASMKEWRRRGVYSGVQAASICRGMRQGEVAYLFNQACICVRAYNSTTGIVPPQDHAALQQHYRYHTSSRSCCPTTAPQVTYLLKVMLPYNSTTGNIPPQGHAALQQHHR